MPRSGPPRSTSGPDDSAPVDTRAHPELYRVGRRGEQGVLTVHPYKDELLPLWRFRTPEVARPSAEALRAAFDVYLAADDLVGADMARKFLQMGFTRARRYANHAGGRKYDGPVPADKRGVSGAHGRAERPRDPEDPVKAESARIFKRAWDEVEQVGAIRHGAPSTAISTVEGPFPRVPGGLGCAQRTR